MTRDMEYEETHVGFDEQYPGKDGGGIKCRNYELCEEILPKWWFDCKGSYLCTNCHIMFGSWGNGANAHTGKGVLDVYDRIECPICLDIKRGISYPRCDHVACLECFRRCVYGDENRDEDDEDEDENLRACPICRA